MNALIVPQFNCCGSSLIKADSKGTSSTCAVCFDEGTRGAKLDNFCTTSPQIISLKAKMMQLINVEQKNIGGQQTNSVLARELHEVLEIKKAFTTWIEAALDSAGAIMDEDYTKLKTSLEGSGYQWEYIITADMAKHIAMMSRVPKGKMVRDYFIEVEKRSTQMAIPSDPMQVLKLMFNAMEHTNAKQIEHDTRIKALEETSSLDSRQQAKIQDEVKSRVKELIKQHNLDIEAKHILFSRMYSMLKREYNVPSYKDIPKARFEEALLKIQGTRFGGVL